MSPTTQKRGIKVDIPPNLEAVLSAAAKNAFVSRTAYVSMALAQHFGMAGNVHLSYTDSTPNPPPAPAVKPKTIEEILANYGKGEFNTDTKKPLVAWPDEDEEEDYKAAPVTKTPEEIAAFAALLDDDET